MARNKLAPNEMIMQLSKLKDPFFEEGREDFLEGAELQDCPYQEGTDGEAGWKIGWREALRNWLTSDLI